MIVDEIKNSLIQAITEIQVNSGRTMIEITNDTCPLYGLEGFDSMNAIETSSLLSEYLGCDIGPDIALFARKGQALPISQIVENIYQEIEHIYKPRGSSHG